MISTGMSVLEYIKENKFANADDICEFVEFNARSIIEDTIEQLNTTEESCEKRDADNTDGSGNADGEEWPFTDDDQDAKP
jgi:hypothetical protein